MKTITLQAFAKVNLHLEVGAVRHDGYHTLKTLFQEISLADALRFETTPGPISIHSGDRRVPTDRDNIIVKALNLLRSKLEISNGMRVQLQKKIPMGAGLGGGSSDAATALWAGWRLWTGCPINKKRVPPVLKSCAKKLGADVTFFLRGGRAWGRGIGEKLTPVPKYKRAWMVLVYPRVHVSTAKAYRWLDQERVIPAEAGIQALHTVQDPGFRRNDFEYPVFKRLPTIRRAKEELTRLGCARVMMSGSGSTVFGCVKNQQEGKRMKRTLRAKPWDVFVVHSV